jgi:hypothetical protein
LALFHARTPPTGSFTPTLPMMPVPAAPALTLDANTMAELNLTTGFATVATTYAAFSKAFGEAYDDADLGAALKARLKASGTLSVGALRTRTVEEVSALLKLGDADDIHFGIHFPDELALKVRFDITDEFVFIQQAAFVRNEVTRSATSLSFEEHAAAFPPG